MLADCVVAPGESRREFYRLIDRLRAKYRPATPSETMLVEWQASYQWRLIRFERLLAQMSTQEAPADLAKHDAWIRCANSIRRLMTRNLRELQLIELANGKLAAS